MGWRRNHGARHVKLLAGCPAMPVTPQPEAHGSSKQPAPLGQTPVGNWRPLMWLLCDGPPHA
eukprot:3377735-Alexandrium_andersonii.AAC.1